MTEISDVMIPMDPIITTLLIKPLDVLISIVISLIAEKLKIEKTL